jgi:hypothetical protein
MPSSRSAAVLLALAVAGVVSACVPSRDPPTTITQVSVEERKRDVAALRDRGVISYEEAARRQFAIQRNAYALSDGEMQFWRASIEIAVLHDQGRITREEYQRRVAAAYQEYVVIPARKRGRAV